MDYRFTQDWFSWSPPVWKQLAQHLPEGDFLEIGSFEGRSTVWTIEHLMRDLDRIVCIDTWEGGEEHVHGEMANAEANFRHNIDLVGQAFPKRYVDVVKGLSVNALAAELDGGRNSYAFVYVDGSHIARDVLTDACMAWPLLRVGGFMVFDDYLWGDISRPNHTPKPAIDAFVNLFIEQLQIVNMGYQFIVRKAR